MSARVHTGPSRAAVAAAFGAVYVIWGSTYLAIKFALETIPPLLMAGFRHLLAGIVLYTFVRLTGGPKPLRIHWRSTAIIGTLLLLGGNGGVCFAEKTVPSGLAALFVTTVPLWMVLLNWLRRDGVRPGIAEVVGVALGLFGVATLMGGLGVVPGEAVDLFGAGVLIVASLCWSWGSIYSRHAPLPKSPLLATAMEMLTGGVMLLIAGAIKGEGAEFVLTNVSGKSILALAYLTVFGSLVAFSAYVWLLQVSTPARVSTYAFVNPIVAVLLGYFLASEQLTARTLVATVVIVTAVLLITLYGKRATKPSYDDPALQPSTVKSAIMSQPIDDASRDEPADRPAKIEVARCTA